ncbi:TRM-domain-containing protein [Ascodesmis nigricans]|uniref:tRNA (guanine(26)-N(2))-dimethyltransferase n=1 Tax=Ascodesmis nigricans TaxID=341454 RepID=A0A4S2N6F7_9PEZI|nr:TRM-domain-containing protein [Ascodesmis nigricans]
MSKRALDHDGDPLPKAPRPSEYARVTFEDGSYTAVREGLANILFPTASAPESSPPADESNIALPDDVFYNPIQQFNRDLSVLSIKLFSEILAEEKASKNASASKRRKNKPAAAASNTTPPQAKFTILDALSATGLRALRYALEIPRATAVTSNDLEPSAVAAIQRNIKYNAAHGKSIDMKKLPPQSAMSKISVTEGNARSHMYSQLAGPKYEVIDLDPYGSAAPFIDAAVQAVVDNGLLCVTCTDAGVWASTGYSEKCMSTYGGIPAKGEFKHEAGLRLILHCIASSAGRYGLVIEPLLSLSIDYYARVFVRVKKSPAQVKNLASTTMLVYNCDSGCGSWYDQRLGKAKEQTGKSGKTTFTKYSLAKAPTVGTQCPECGFAMHLAGPMWGGPLHSPDFVSRFLASLPEQSTEIYGTIPRIMGMLESAELETSLNSYPFFHVTDRLSKAMHCEAPPLAAVRGALVGMGYKVARSHCRPVSFKTDAPHEAVWDVMKKWVESIPKKGDGLKEGMAGYTIMKKREGKDLSHIKLDMELGKDEMKSAIAVKYQLNPTANWGPMGRARGKGIGAKDEQPVRKKSKTLEDAEVGVE